MTSNRTQVGIAVTRLPEDARRNLLALAQRGYEFCVKIDARNAAKLCDGLSLAIMDLAAMEVRAQRAERSLALARRRIVDLEARIRSEFDETTRTVAPNPLLLKG